MSVIEQVNQCFFSGQSTCVEALRDQVTRLSATDADCFLQHTYEESWVLDQGIIKETIYHEEQGLGVRVVQDQTTGYAYTERLDQTSVMTCLQMAAQVAQRNSEPKAVNIASQITPCYLPDNPLLGVNHNQKVHRLIPPHSIT